MVGVMALFFGTIITVNLTLAVFANTSWTGLVVKNTYVESQRFNAVTGELENQRRLGWVPRIVYENGSLTLRLRDADGAPVRGANVAIRIGRPVHENDDLDIVLKEAREGEYASRASLGTGEWIARIEATAPAGQFWSHAVRFTIRDPR